MHALCYWQISYITDDNSIANESIDIMQTQLMEWGYIFSLKNRFWN